CTLSQELPISGSGTQGSEVPTRMRRDDDYSPDDYLQLARPARRRTIPKGVLIGLPIAVALLVVATLALVSFRGPAHPASATSSGGPAATRPPPPPGLSPGPTTRPTPPPSPSSR